MDHLNIGNIILDNGGGVTLQMGEFAHYYDDMGVAANDIGVWMHEGNTDDWEGNDIEAGTLEPTDDEIRNGGYRIIRMDRRVDTRSSLIGEIDKAGAEWGNAGRLALALHGVAAWS
jgi:hypothetical protein